jgi:hypothetical protein
MIKRTKFSFSSRDMGSDKMLSDMDFTIKKYEQLLNSLIESNYSFKTYSEYVLNPGKHFVILRHDVDDKPENSLKFAEIQAKKGIYGTFYFRIVPQSYNEIIIKKITDLGHEIGYHYETMDTNKGDVDKAYIEFCRNLEKFQKLTTIKTISMHGSPMSPFDNRAIWHKYSYKKLGILAEPYFDINFNDLFYITDTGRRWNGHLYNIRDKATKDNPVTNPHFLSLNYKYTTDIINAINGNSFPTKAMLNFHPQRWNNEILPWTKELIFQNIKNQVKRVYLLTRTYN